MENLIQQLRELLPEDAVISDAAARRVYECDGLSAYRQLPGVVVLPETVEQVQAILRLCHQTGTPVVARGAGTGLAGGALPMADGVLMGMARFNRVLSIDVDNRLATVEPGVRNLAISEAVAPYELYYAPDPSSQIACTIGGNVAENSGGVHCLKYGLTVHNIAAVEIITMEGESLTIGSDAYDSAGYDLLALLTGSEGLLGVFVSITVRLIPKPQSIQVLLAAFDDVEHAGEAVAAIIAEGIIPAGLEMMDELAIQAAEDFIHAGYPLNSQAMLLCELDGCDEEVVADVERVQKIFKNFHAIEIRSAVDAEERQILWAGRKAAFPAVGRLAPDYYCMDGTIPRRYLAKVLARINELSKEYNLAVANVFHAGDGNLHPLILYNANTQGELERAEAFGQQILALCVEVGGTVTGEHGVGVEKLDSMCLQFATAELNQFHAVKHAFDAEGLLNPGKAIPSLHRCVELGAMHVHQGNLLHPELERF